MNCNSLGFSVLTRTQSLLRLMSIELVMSTFLSSVVPSPPAFSVSQCQGLFQWVGSSHKVAKVLELQLEDQSFQWVFRTDFLRIHWIDLLAIKGILKSLLQYHSWKESILQCSDFFMVHLSLWYITAGKTTALTIQIFTGKMMSF